MESNQNIQTLGALSGGAVLSSGWANEPVRVADNMDAAPRTSELEMLASVASSERVYWNPDQRPMVAPMSEFQQIDSDVFIRPQTRAGTHYSVLGARPTHASTQTSVGIAPTSF